MSIHQVITTTPPKDAKLGGRLPVYPLARVDMSKHFDTSAPYTPPPAVHRSHWGFEWPMAGNDQYGDCFAAAMSHSKQEWALNDNESAPNYGTDVTLDVYSQVAGFNPDAPLNPDGSNPTDQGTDPNQAFAQWMNPGIKAFGNDKISGVGGVQPTNRPLVERGMDEFEVLFTSFALPLFAQNQSIWDAPTNGDLSGNNAPGSWGYHEVITLSYDVWRVAFISWGSVRVMTWNFWMVYVQRADVVLDQSILNKTGKSVTGLNYDTLNADLAATYTNES